VVVAAALREAVLRALLLRVVVVLAQAPLLVDPALLPDLALLLRVVVVLAQAPLLVDPASLPDLALLLQVEVVLAQAPLLALLAHKLVEAEAPVVEAPLTRSFSAAMEGILPSPGPPMYAPVRRSRRNPRRRPCPLT
jgi:hypothetical protein